MYNTNDIELLKENFNKIDKEIKIELLNKVDPRRKVIISITNIILKFIKTKKRIIYGGIAHNEAILMKNKKDAFYQDDDYGDIDFYSYEPLQDMVDIANLLYNNGLTYIYCKEALHEDTFTITVDNRVVCDITYMPKYIYDHLPIFKNNNLNYVGPHLAILDYLRMFTEPMFSSFRWEKSIKRIYLLEKYYPFKFQQTLINSSQKIPDILHDVFEIISEQPNIFIGDYMYNYIIKKSDGSDFIPIQNYQIISINYKRDINEIYKKIHEKYPSIETKEFHPFFQYTGMKTQYLYNNYVILEIYDSNEICYPFFKLEKIDFNNSNKISNSQTVNIATFPLIILFYLINAIYYKIFKEKNKSDINYYKITELIKIRNDYLKKHKKTIFDITIFREFSTKCIGDTITLQQKKRRENLKKTQRIVYDPEQKLNISFDYNFKNISGKEITNIKKLKIKKI